MGLRPTSWPPTQRQELGVSVLVALLLVANPLYLPVLNLDLTGHTYAVEPVSIEDGRIAAAGESLRVGPIDGIACSEYRPAVECAYERTHVQRDELEFDLSDPRVEIDTRYAYHRGTGETAYYRRMVSGEPFPETLILEPVAPQTVVESVAVSPDQLSVRGRIGLALGWMHSDQPLSDAYRIVDTGDEYVMLVETRRSSSGSGDLIETGVSVFMALVGLLLLWRTYRWLPAEWE